MIKHFKGTKYDGTERLSLKEVIPLIRKDLKTYTDKCKKTGHIIKLTLRTQYYSMGQTVHVTIQDTNFNLSNPKYKVNQMTSTDNPYFTKEYEKLKEVIEHICNQYNHEDSDNQTDYFSTKFFIDIHISNKLREKEKECHK